MKMKKLKLLLTPMLIALFFTSCCKDDIQCDCEINNTFQLHYKNNYYYTPTTLCVMDNDTTNYTVEHNQLIIVDVQVDYSKISIIQNEDTVDVFTLRPNPCANINYYH